MATATKKLKAAESIFDREKDYSVEEAFGILKKLPNAKFDETVDMSLRLGVDPKHADQMVRGAIVLPHGIGKTVRVAVFAKGEKDREAREAGADVVGGRGPGREDPGRLHGLRLDDRDARPHGPGGPARQGAGPARPHAQPEARHRDVRRGPRGARGQGGQGRVPGGQGGQRARPGGQEVVRGAAPGREHPRPPRGDRAGQARPRPRDSTCAR